MPCACSCTTILKLTGIHLFRLGRTKKTTETIAKVTTAVAGAVGTAVGTVAQGAVSTAKRSGVAKEGSTSRHAARVGKAGLVALVEVFDAMHDAGRKVVQQGATETATCVQYRCAFSWTLYLVSSWPLQVPFLRAYVARWPGLAGGRDTPCCSTQLSFAMARFS